MEPSALAASVQATGLRTHACRYNCRLKEEFVSVVQQRGEAVIKARKQSSSLSAASAACDHMRDWILGTPKVQDMPSSKLAWFELYLSLYMVVSERVSFCSAGHVGVYGRVL